MKRAENASHKRTLTCLLGLMICVVFIRLLPPAMPSLEQRAQQLAIIETTQQIYANSGKINYRGLEPRVLQKVAQQRELWYQRSLQIATELKQQHQYKAEDKKNYTFLSNFDGYFWLRLARNKLTTGSICDNNETQHCRNNLTLAPTGSELSTVGLPHVNSIVYLHKIIQYFRPDYPIAASAYCLTVILALLAVIPAFFIGKRLAGISGGFSAGFISALGSVYIGRSMGADTDGWHVLLLLTLLWCLQSLFYAKKWPSQLILISLLACTIALWAKLQSMA